MCGSIVAMVPSVPRMTTTYTTNGRAPACATVSPSRSRACSVDSHSRTLTLVVVHRENDEAPADSNISRMLGVSLRRQRVRRRDAYLMAAPLAPENSCIQRRRTRFMYSIKFGAVVFRDVPIVLIGSHETLTQAQSATKIRHMRSGG